MALRLAEVVLRSAGYSHTSGGQGRFHKRQYNTDFRTETSGVGNSGAAACGFMGDGIQDLIVGDQQDYGAQGEAGPAWII